MQMPEHVDMRTMTHFVFARSAPGGGTLGGKPGDLVYGAGTAGESFNPYSPGWIAQGDPANRSVEDYLLDKARAQGTKTLLMVGGEGDGDGWRISTTTNERPRFIRNLLDYLEVHRYDGVDIDWEDGLDDAANQAQLIALLKELRTASLQRARYVTAPLIITFPGYALNTNIDTVDPWKVEVAKLVDQYNLMSYAMGYDADGWDTTFFCPVEGATGSRPMDLKSSVQAYVDKGVPRSKIGIGIGFYGMNYGPPTDGPRKPIPAGVSVQSNDTEWAYGNLVRRGYLSHGTETWDPVARQHWRTYGAGGYQPAGPEAASTAGYLSYEDPASIRAKGEWVIANGIGGTIIWLINYGSPDGRSNPLMDAAKAGFRV
jgi:chitinase